MAVPKTSSETSSVNDRMYSTKHECKQQLIRSRRVKKSYKVYKHKDKRIRVDVSSAREGNDRVCSWVHRISRMRRRWGEIKDTAG